MAEKDDLQDLKRKCINAVSANLKVIEKIDSLSVSKEKPNLESLNLDLETIFNAFRECTPPDHLGPPDENHIGFYPNNVSKLVVAVGWVMHKHGLIKWR